MPHLSERPGCGRSPSGSTKIEHRRTVTRRHARPQWQHSRRAGGGNKADADARATNQTVPMVSALTTNKSQSTELPRMKQPRDKCKLRVDTNMTLVPAADPIPRAHLR